MIMFTFIAVTYLVILSRLHIEIIPILVLFIAALRMTVITLRTVNSHSVSIKIQKRDMNNIVDLVNLLKETMPRSKTVIAAASAAGLFLGGLQIYLNDLNTKIITRYTFLINDVNKDIDLLYKDIQKEKQQYYLAPKNKFLYDDILKKEEYLNKLREKKDLYTKKMEVR